MKIPLHRITEEKAIEMVANSAYFTRLFNDLTVRKMKRDCQLYYLRIIERAGYAMRNPAEFDVTETVKLKCKVRLAAFANAAETGHLGQGVDPNLRIFGGGKAGG